VSYENREYIEFNCFLKSYSTKNAVAALSAIFCLTGSSERSEKRFTVPTQKTLKQLSYTETAFG